MYKTIFAVLIAASLAGCAGAPKPYLPLDGERVPVNKSVPDEIKNGNVPSASQRGQS